MSKKFTVPSIYISKGTISIYTIKHVEEIIAPMSLTEAIMDHHMQVVCTVDRDKTYVPQSEVERVLKEEMRQPLKMPRATEHLNMEIYQVSKAAELLGITRESLEQRIQAGKAYAFQSYFSLLISRPELERIAKTLGYQIGA